MLLKARKEALALFVGDEGSLCGERLMDFVKQRIGKNQHRMGQIVGWVRHGGWKAG